jgi:hypothetical protein
MDLATILVLALFGGYAFYTRWRVTAYHAKRAEGQHLYLQAAHYGARLFIGAFVAHIVAMVYWQRYADTVGAVAMGAADALLSASHGVLQEHLVVAAAYASLLGGPLAGVLNLIQSRERALQQGLNALDAQLRRAQLADMPVSLTLTNGKVYIGLVVKITDPDRPPASIVLFPMLSGHRGGDGRLRITTDYEKVYDPLDRTPGKPEALGLPTVWESNFYLVLRADQIVTASMFSPAVFSEFNPGWRESIDARAAPPPRQEVLVEFKEPARKPLWKRS